MSTAASGTDHLPMLKHHDNLTCQLQLFQETACKTCKTKAGGLMQDTNTVSDSTKQASTPEDYWSPFQITPTDKVYMDPPVKVAPPPDHDGTECLKWDDSLWTHAEHFKVRKGA